MWKWLVTWIRIAACGVTFVLVNTTIVGNRVSNATVNSAQAGRVVLIHGLARSASSMTAMSDALQSAGYEVCNVEYPSREHTIAILTKDFVAPAIAACFPTLDQPLHFVTHSLGGIIVRQLAADNAIHIGRVVMLSPPNHGSEVVDKLRNVWGFEWLNGPAGMELGTHSDAAPAMLGPATFELGIITGVRTINPFLSLLIPGQDDGKVAVEQAKLKGMSDFLVLRCSHPYIMESDHAIEQTLNFLQQGKFLHHSHFDTSVAHTADVEEPGDCWN